MSDESVLDRLDVIKEALQTVPSVFLVGASGLLSIVIFARLLSQAQVGLYSVGLSIVMLVNALAIGIGLAVKKKVSEGDNNKTAYLSSGLILLVTWLFISISVLLLATPILQTYTEFTTNQITALAFFVFCHCVFTLVREYISGVGYPGKAEISAVFRASIMLVSQIALITLVQYGVFGLFIGGGVGYGVGTVLLFGFGIKKSVISNALPKKETLKNVLSFSKWSILDQSLSTSYRWFDTVVVFVLGGAAVSGQFKILYTVVTGAVMFSNGIRKPVYVKLSNLHGKNKNIAKTSSVVSGYISWAAIGALFGVIAFGNEILFYVFGAEYSQGGLSLIILGIFMVFFTQRIGFEMFYYVQDKPRVSMRMNILVVVSFFVSLIIQFATGIASSLPIISVASSLLFAEIVRYIGYLMMIKSETGVWFVSKVPIENVFSGAVMCLVLFTLKQSVGVNSIKHLFVFICIGFGVYLLVERFLFGRSLSAVKDELE